MSSSTFPSVLPVEHYKEYLKSDVRPDGRELGEFRQMTVSVGSIATADGSALVQMGSTMVVCGVKAELTKPFASDPNRGIIVPNVELSPMCAAHFKSGPPGEQAQIASQFLDDILRTSKVIDTEKLCICVDKLVWVLYCDLVCLSYDGNLNDACVMAAIAALGNTTLLKVEYDEDNDAIKTSDDPEQSSKLELEKIVLSSSFSQFESTHIIADPTLKEEQITTGMLTIVIDSSGQVCHIHRPGGLPLQDGTVQKCVERASENCKKLHAMLDKLISK